MVDLMSIPRRLPSTLWVMVELAGEIGSAFARCFLLQYIASPLFFAMWLSVYVVVATSS